MPKNILIDLNVVIDALLQRGDYQSAQRLLDSAEEIGIRLHISSHMVTTLAYLLEAAKIPDAEIRKQLHWLLRKFEVVAVDKEVLRAAAGSAVNDFEDAVVERAAIKSRSEAIITGNIRDFAQSEVQAITARKFIQSF